MEHWGDAIKFERVEGMGAVHLPKRYHVSELPFDGQPTLLLRPDIE